MAVLQLMVAHALLRVLGSAAPRVLDMIINDILMPWIDFVLKLLVIFS